MERTQLDSKELLLIGTVHRDPDGAAKLKKLLAEKRPVALAVEVSPYGLFYRQKNYRPLLRRLMRRVRRLAYDLKVSWREWGQIEAMRIQLQLPFEYRMAQRYCRDTGATISCVDSSLWSKSWINDHWQQLLSSENLKGLLAYSPANLAEEVGSEYKIATLLFSSPERSLPAAFNRPWSTDNNWQKREKGLAKMVEKAYARVLRGRVAYVGGWQHLLGPNAGGTLYERLEHLQPRRVLLSNGAWGNTKQAADS
ncbi:MAG: hypothetical protein PVH33_05225 [Syntrophobacterales bacterium]|jgi:hypothetical protein